MDVVTSLWNNNLIAVTENGITDFLRKQNVFAVIGVSSNPAKYGHQIYKDLKEAGYVVYPVNPNIDSVSGDRCYHLLSELPEKPDVVDIVVPAEVTEKLSPVVAFPLATPVYPFEGESHDLMVKVL